MPDSPVFPHGALSHSTEVPTDAFAAHDLADGGALCLPATLAELGWGPPFAAAFDEHARDGQLAGRVARVDRDALTVLTDLGESRALVAPHLAHRQDPLQLPTVGDWVVIEGGAVVEVVSPGVSSPGRRRRGRQATGARGRTSTRCSSSARWKDVSTAPAGAPGGARLAKRRFPGGCADQVGFAPDLAGALEAAEELTGGGDVVALSSLSGGESMSFAPFSSPG